MSQDDKKQTERPDHWLGETTTPGLLVQVDTNTGETEAVFAGASARTAALRNLAPSFQAGLDRMADEFNKEKPLMEFDLIRQTFPGINGSQEQASYPEPRVRN